MELLHFCPDCEERRLCEAGTHCNLLYSAICGPCIDQREREDAIEDAMHNITLRNERESEGR